MDIITISKDKKTLLVAKLKKGKATDVVLRQILRYMGYAKAEQTEERQTVKGDVTALEDDKNPKGT